MPITQLQLQFPALDIARHPAKLVSTLPDPDLWHAKYEAREDTGPDAAKLWLIARF